MLLTLAEEAIIKRDIISSPLFSDPGSDKNQKKFGSDEYYFALEETSGTIHLILGEQKAKELEILWKKDKSKKFVKTGESSIVKKVVKSKRGTEWNLMLKGYDNIVTYNTDRTLEVTGHFGDMAIFQLSNDTETQGIKGKGELAVTEWDVSEHSSKKPENVKDAMKFMTSDTSMGRFLGPLSKTLSQVELSRVADAIEEALHSSVPRYIEDNRKVAP